MNGPARPRPPRGSRGVAPGGEVASRGEVAPPPSRAYLCELAWLPPGETRRDVLVRVDGTRITDVVPGVTDPPPSAVRLDGLTLPGFANVHSHAFHRALRGRTHAARPGERGSFWTWRERMYDVAGRLDPDRYYDLALGVYAEMVLAGVTCVGEFHYVHHRPDGTPYDEPNVMAEVLVAAARAAGLRITLLDTCYLTGGIGVPLRGVQRRFGDRDVATWAERATALAAAHVAEPDVVVGAAVHSVRAVPREALPAVASWAAHHHAPLHVHLSEQPQENDHCRQVYGLSPTRLLFDTGVLGARTTAVHATHLDGDGVGLLAGSGTTVCACPTTERDLADGLGRAGVLARAGAAFVLGSDSHAVVDMFEEARGLEWGERLTTLERSHWPVAGLLASLTETGHEALGFPDAGLIAPGAWADLVSVRLDSVRTAGATPDNAAEAVVFAASASDVHSVVASGTRVVAAGRHQRLPEVTRLLGAAVRAVL